MAAWSGGGSSSLWSRGVGLQESGRAAATLSVGAWSGGGAPLLLWWWRAQEATVAASMVARAGAAAQSPTPPPTRPRFVIPCDSVFSG